MVKIDLNAFDDLSTEEIENELKRYKKSGFRWRKTGEDLDRCQIWTQNFLTEPQLLFHYFKYAELKIGDKEQIEMYDALNLFSIISNKRNIDYWDSESL